jgi:hypothetical protein
MNMLFSSSKSFAKKRLFNSQKQIVFTLFVWMGFIFFIFMNTQAQSESKNVPKDWQTLSEKTDYRQTPRYAETIAYSRKLADTSPLIEYKSFE